MSDEITVTVVDYGRKFLMLRYRDPLSGKLVSKSAKTADRGDAEKAAGKWEAELREGRYQAPSKATWEAFRDRYEKEHLASLASKTADKVATVLDAVETILSPKLLREVTAGRLSYFQSKLRESGKAEQTISGYAAHLAAALKWATTVGLLSAAPKMQKPKRAKQQKVMKGRPVTGEEFDRMLAAVPKALQTHNSAKQLVEAPAETVEAWRHYLRGLWWSGLRLAESLELYWDRDDKLCVDLDGKRPVLRIPAALEKGNQTRVLPMAPEFAEFLAATPKAKRTGRVFNPQPIRDHGQQLTPWRVGRVFSAIGEKAGVVVEPAKGTPPAEGEEPNGYVPPKFASAHDLRRSFGERWASRVMPQVLMVLMRHESIETTMRYYVGRNAHTVADVLWQAHEKARPKTGNTSGNTQVNSDACQNSECSQTVEGQDVLK